MLKIHPDLAALAALPDTERVQVNYLTDPDAWECLRKLALAGCVWIHSYVDSGGWTRKTVISLSRDGIDKQHELEDLAGFPRTPRQLGMWNR